MSWSVSYIGTPEKISEALDRQKDILSGQSLEEFDAALPALKTLLSLNYGDQYTRQLIANGHAYTTEGITKYSTVSVELKNIGAILA